MSNTATVEAGAKQDGIKKAGPYYRMLSDGQKVMLSIFEQGLRRDKNGFYYDPSANRTWLGKMEKDLAAGGVIVEGLEGKAEKLVADGLLLHGKRMRQEQAGRNDEHVQTYALNLKYLNEFWLMYRSTHFALEKDHGNVERLRLMYRATHERIGMDRLVPLRTD